MNPLPRPAGVHVTAAELVLVLAALAEAAGDLRRHAATCAACHASPSDLCDTCDSGLGRAEAYARIAARLEAALQSAGRSS